MAAHQPTGSQDGVGATTVKRGRAKIPFVRLAGIGVGTLIEALSLYGWLRLHESGQPWLALGILVAGEVLETALLTAAVRNGVRKRWGPMKAAGSAHFRKVERVTGWAGTLEVGIWMLWLASVQWFDQPVASAVGLLVLMHVKHHAESMAICDTRFRTGLWSKQGTFASAMEVAGAVACLALIDHGQFVLAGLVLGAGLLIEHTVQIGTLRWEIRARDIRMPRDSRWRPPSRMREPIGYLTSHFPMLWRLVQRIVPLARWFNRFAIRNMALVVDPRPNPLSTMAPYTSWSSLTDRTYSGRHLPPASAQPSAEARNAPPSTDDVAVLFERRGDMAECPKSTVLFSFFAQWFTDGFLRTARDVPRGELRDTLRNESNHEIDLVQIYGLNREMTEQLRARRGGLLKSQWIDGEEYPEYYCRDGVPRQEFDKLLTPVGFRKMQRADRDMLFAIGSDITNLGVVAFNVLFLREHNRIAARLSAEHPAWDDDRVFETTRNVLTVVLLKIVIDEYINHIAPYHFRFWLAPESFPNEQWYRPNWMAIEFNLLYRWHSMVPSTFHLNGEDLPIEEMLYDTTRLTAAGLGSVMAAASDQPAGRISLGNTDPLLVDWAEKPSIDQARAADLCSYNDYRRLCRYPAAADFDDISADPEIQARLKATYGSVEDVEFYVGLFAEDTMPNGVLPPLIAAMVSFDAFSQALTNPLLAPRIYNEHTFSPTGMQIIAETGSISDIVRRNVPQGSAPDFVSLTRRDPAQT